MCFRRFCAFHQTHALSAVTSAAKILSGFVLLAGLAFSLPGSGFSPLASQRLHAQETSGVQPADGTIPPTAPSRFLPILLSQRPVECPPPNGCALPDVDALNGLAVHPTTGILYVTLAVLASAPTGDQPWGVAVDERNGHVYVSNFGSGDVWIYDATTLALRAVVPVGEEPTLVATLPERNTALVLLHRNSRVAVIEEMAKTLDLPSGGSGPAGIAVDRLRSQAYVSHRDSGHFATVRFTGSSWQTRSNLLLDDGRRLFAVAYDPVIQRLYAHYQAATGQWFVDTWKPEPWPAQWGHEATVAVPSSGSVGSPQIGGAGLAVNPATGLLYTANTADRSVSVVASGGATLVDTLATGEDPFAVAADGTANRVYIGLREPGRLIVLQ
ncbi:MAG: YncE family protein [Caldilinea sp.]|nr:YncE family protein [Caldilinea sp.]